jgi:hypothetical protein
VDSKIIIGTAAGLAVGLGVGYYMGGQKPPIVLPAPAPAAAAPAGGGFGVVPQPGQLGGGAPAGMPAGMPAMPPPGAQGGAHAARIQHNEHLVKSDPKNLQAWIELGNDYFDTHDPQRSIAAYAKALALDPKNPNVLTDQGVMYRQVGSEPRPEPLQPGHRAVPGSEEARSRREGLDPAGAGHAELAPGGAGPARPRGPEGPPLIRAAARTAQPAES